MGRRDCSTARLRGSPDDAVRVGAEPISRTLSLSPGPHCRTRAVVASHGTAHRAGRHRQTHACPSPSVGASLRVLHSGSVTRTIYTGSFDPIHLGHLALFAQASELLDGVVVAVLGNPAKPGMFTKPERDAAHRSVRRYAPERPRRRPRWHGRGCRRGRRSQLDYAVGPQGPPRRAHDGGDEPRALAW